MISQANAGLTRSLIRGCEEVRAEVIARHDCGDRSHPERFARQLALLGQGAVLVSCATRFSDRRRGFELYVARADGDEVRRSLLTDDASRIHALPHHGSAMFRRDAYETAGGYRAEFRVAQDLDLWIRIAPRGTIAMCHEVLYEAHSNPAASAAVIATAGPIHRDRRRIARRRRVPHHAAALIVPARASRAGEAAALYFIGKCLLQQRNGKGRRYLREAIRRDPWHWRAWASLLLGR